MERESYPIVTEACPCGAGQVQIDIISECNGWTTNSYSHESITCQQCADNYTFVSMGRGVGLVRTEEYNKREDILKKAGEVRSAFWQSGDIAALLDELAFRLDALPTMKARYELARALDIESCTLPTFRKHTRGIPSRRWLGWRYESSGGDLECFLPIYEYIGCDSSAIRACLQESAQISEGAKEFPQVVASFGPINLFAAMSERGKEAEARRIVGENSLGAKTLNPNI